MAGNLVLSLLEAHLEDRDDSGVARVFIDHALVGEPDAALVLLAFERIVLGRDSAGTDERVVEPRVGVELALVCAEPARLDPDAAAMQAFEQAAALRWGARFARPGAGLAHHVYAECFALPGRVLLSNDARAACCGALGMLVLRGGMLEMAVALSGAPHRWRRPQVVGVRLRGSLPPRVSGHDVALELERRLRAGSAERRALEYFGPGVATLPMVDRITISRLGAQLGATASLFPSDESTRRFLAARDRETDWKRLVASEEFDEVVDLELDTVVPRLANPELPQSATAAREVAGEPVERVLIGAEAGYGDLARFVATLGDRAVSEGVSVAVEVGSRQIFETAVQSGVLAALNEAGVRVSEGASAPPEAGAGSTGLGLCFGSRDLTAAGDSRLRWMLASPESCAAAALAGCICDPRSLSGPSLADPDPEQVVAVAGWVLVPDLETPSPVLERAAGFQPLPMVPPLTTPLRGRVLIKLGDGVSVDDILPWGARTAALRADLASLAALAFRVRDRGFAARAREHGGGFVLAGRNYGAGEEREQATLVLAALGVRAVFARSFAEPHRQQLIDAGLLPLRLLRQEDLDTAAAGDEFEIPGLPESLEPARPLMVRNLTRGNQLGVQHDLDARGIERVRAGGLLSLAAREPLMLAKARS